MCQATRCFLFGYGSLMWRCGFDYEFKFDGYIKSYTRNFSLIDTFHRGTREAPGRCVNVHYTGNDNDKVYGTCYLLREDHIDNVLNGLDTRESCYRKIFVPVYVQSGICATMTAIMYIQEEEEEQEQEEHSLEQIAQIISRSIGHSGTNYDYLNQLYRSLESMNGLDDYLKELYLLVSIQKQQPQHQQQLNINIKGTIIVDDGAVQAISNKAKALLPCGIINVKNRFERGDVVEIVCAGTMKRIAIGKSNYDYEQVMQIKGKHSKYIQQLLLKQEHHLVEHVVSREFMVLT
jgi:cation transport protein ChaC